MSFMSAIGADPDEFHRVDFHTCHEALLLEYEHALTRIDSRTGNPYDVSGHFVWIGERTNAPRRRPRRAAQPRSATRSGSRSARARRPTT